MGSDADREAAGKRVEVKLGFYIHLAVYVAVNLLLIVINLATKSEKNEAIWFIYPLAGWGIGVLFHWVMMTLILRGGSLKETLIQKELAKQAEKKS